MSGNYRAIDPRVYGIHIRSTPRASISGDTNNKGTRDKDKDPSDASHNRSSGTQSSSTSSTALDTTFNPAQGVTQFIDGTRNGELLSSLTTTTTPTLSSTIAPHSSRREPATTDQQAKHEQRRQRLKESHNRRRRERIAKKVGHEIDSDGEREYWRAVYDRSMAESARREALSPEARRQEDIESAAKAFRSHIEPILAFDDAGVAHLQHYPLFLLQRAPESHNGAACRLPHCFDRIAPGQYRIAVSPGSWDPRGPDGGGGFEPSNHQIQQLSSMRPVYNFHIPPAQNQNTLQQRAQGHKQNQLPRQMMKTKPQKQQNRKY
ncbi:hypothetical protein HRR75_004251 [Exophiala dermatitidis]|nr:hypothetical protein HRR75_004251 [Exophiala dermatitidis]